MALDKISFSDIVKVNRNNKIHRHVTAHLTVLASQEWLNTVHRVVQIQIKGSCCNALDIPAELSAKIVQVLFHFYHTGERETERTKWQTNEYIKLLFTVTEQNVVLRRSDKNQEQILHTDTAVYTRCGLYNLERRALRFQLEHVQDMDVTVAVCAK